jgi:hypothetical protein
MRYLYLCACRSVREIVVDCIVDRCSGSDDISFDGEDCCSLSLPLSQSVVHGHGLRFLPFRLPDRDRLRFLPLCLPNCYIFFLGRFRFPAGGCQPMSVITAAATTSSSVTSCIDACRQEQGDNEKLDR